MVLVKPALIASVAVAAVSAFTSPKTLDVNNAGWSIHPYQCYKAVLLTVPQDSVKAIAGSLAFGAMSYYNGNVSSDPKV